MESHNFSSSGMLPGAPYETIKLNGCHVYGLDDERRDSFSRSHEEDEISRRMHESRPVDWAWCSIHFMSSVPRPIADSFFDLLFVNVKYHLFWTLVIIVVALCCLLCWRKALAGVCAHSTAVCLRSANRHKVGMKGAIKSPTRFLVRTVSVLPRDTWYSTKLRRRIGDSRCND